MLSEIIEGIIYAAAGALLFGGRRWKYPKVADAGYQYQLAYLAKHPRIDPFTKNPLGESR